MFLLLASFKPTRTCPKPLHYLELLHPLGSYIIYPFLLSLSFTYPCLTQLRPWFLAPFLFFWAQGFLTCPWCHVLCQQSLVSTSGIQPPNLLSSQPPALFVHIHTACRILSPVPAGPTVRLCSALLCSSQLLPIFSSISLPDLFSQGPYPVHRLSAGQPSCLHETIGMTNSSVLPRADLSPASYPFLQCRAALFSSVAGGHM